MRHWIGTSGFQYPEWKGKFYPEKMPATKMLAFYGQHFSSTEVNYTFRHIPSEKTIQTWSGATPTDFVFSFKAPQRVTHFSKLRGCAEVLRVLQTALSLAGEKLGPVLFQLPPSFSKDVELLRAFLNDVPESMRAAFEFRHKSWFDDTVFETLRTGNATLCIAEDDELATPPIVTADFGYLRLRRAEYTAGEIKKWASWIREQGARWSDAHIYFKHEEEARGVKFAQAMQKVVA